MTLSSKNLNLMTPSLFSRNIVLIGGFDLAIFDRYFFIKNEIFNDKDIQYQSSFNPQQVIQIFNSKYNFFITPNQIIISSLSLNNLVSNNIVNAYPYSGRIKQYIFKNSDKTNDNKDLI